MDYFSWSGESDPVVKVLESAFTFSAWIKTTQVGGGGDNGWPFSGAGIVWADVSGIPPGPVFDAIPMALTGNKLAAFFVLDPDPIHSLSDINTGEWVHVVAFRQQGPGAVGGLYVNGKLEVSRPANTADLSLLNQLVLGGNVLDGRYYNGLLDDFQVYDRALNATEVLYLFNNPGSAITEPSSVVLSRYPYHDSYAGAGTPPWNRLDTSKTMVKEGTEPQLLTYDNLINTAQGINGIVFDIENLPDAGDLSTGDFEFQVSPQGAFDEGANPTSEWQTAPAPSSISVTAGTPARVLIQWPDESIMNRWLRVTVLATAETGLAEAEVYYLGHLLGETTGPEGGVFTVSFTDITSIRAEVGQTVDATSGADINKNGTVSFADISAMRSSVGTQLTIIAVP